MRLFCTEKQKAPRERVGYRPWVDERLADCRQHGSQQEAGCLSDNGSSCFSNDCNVKLTPQKAPRCSVERSSPQGNGQLSMRMWDRYSNIRHTCNTCMPSSMSGEESVLSLRFFRDIVISFFIGCICIQIPYSLERPRPRRHTSRTIKHTRITRITSILVVRARCTISSTFRIGPTHACFGLALASIGSV